MGIAVSTPRGLIVPVLRDADQLDFAGIEQSIFEYGNKARDGHLSYEDLTGGTFTITNGGIFGSMLSTPFLTRRNAPSWVCMRLKNVPWSKTVKLLFARSCTLPYLMIIVWWMAKKPFSS